MFHLYFRAAEIAETGFFYQSRILFAAAIQDTVNTAVQSGLQFWIPLHL